MPAETIARPSALSGAPDEDDYQAFCQALSASERGRALLAEYARRNRGADTEQLQLAIEQLQSVMVAQSPPQRTELVKRQLRELLDEIGTAQCEVDALLLATKTEALAELIARVESRISGILWSLRSDAFSGGRNRTPRIRDARRRTRPNLSRGRSATRPTRIANSIAKRLEPAGHCAGAWRGRIGRSGFCRNTARADQHAFG